MNTSRNEHTIATTCEISGRGYWSGREVRVCIDPASAGTGIQLVRDDLPGAPTCPASIDYRLDAALRTNLIHGDAKFQMVEHLLAALTAMEIDNCIVAIDGEEFPGLDGSSAAYVEALRGAGLIIQARAKHRLVVTETIRIEEQGCWLEASPTTDGRAYYEYRLSFDDPTPIAAQTFGLFLTPYQFIRDVSRARTFVTESQASQIRSSGLAAHVTNQELLVIGSNGPIDNTLHYPNECARHKTLDLIGDLALAGIDLVGRFVSFRGGHNLNGKMAKRLAELANSESQKSTQKTTWRRAA